MILYHATTRTNLESIRSHGLQVRYASAQGRIKAVWLHTSSKSTWAIVHTQKRHQATLEDVVVVAVSVPRRTLKKFQTGLWYSISDIPPRRILRVIDGTDYAASAK